jgi:hypothetical protein
VGSRRLIQEKKMSFQVSLFEGRQVCLAPIDREKDAEIEAAWMHDAEYLRMLHESPARPLTAAAINKKYEQIEKQMDEEHNLFYFTIRHREDERLLGFARLYWISWTSGYSFVELGIGNRQDRRMGYGCETLTLLKRFAFRELNLHRLTAVVADYNLPAKGLFAKAGFLEEARRREALRRDGRCWDSLMLGLLRQDWEREK